MQISTGESTRRNVEVSQVLVAGVETFFPCEFLSTFMHDSTRRGEIGLMWLREREKGGVDEVQSEREEGIETVEKFSLLMSLLLATSRRISDYHIRGPHRRRAII